MGTRDRPGKNGPNDEARRNPSFMHFSSLPSSFSLLLSPTSQPFKFAFSARRQRFQRFRPTGAALDLGLGMVVGTGVFFW
jgi:hypothetical protein